MGVTYYSCDDCRAPFDSYADYKRCGHCGGIWCEDCADHVKIFTFKGRERCSECVDSEPDVPTESELLKFALTQLGGITQEALTATFLQTTTDSRFHRALEPYICTQCPKGTCPSTLCERVSQDYDTPDPEDEFPMRGYCCAVQDLGGNDFCQPCRQFRARTACIVLLGIRKYRPESPLARLHGDVLRNLIIREILMRSLDAWLIFDKPKKTKKKSKKSVL